MKKFLSVIILLLLCIGVSGCNNMDSSKEDVGSAEVMEDKTFSNARMVRNLYERAWGKAAYRRSLSGEERIVLRKEDLACALEEAEFKRLGEKKGSRPIGFGN